MNRQQVLASMSVWNSPGMDAAIAGFEALLTRIKAAIPGADETRIWRAFALTVEGHGDQLRKDGTPFITHPIAAASIIVEMGLDEDSIIAALLHDLLEDTSVRYEQIEKEFGSSVAIIVEGVTKLTRVQYTSKEEEQMENLRKMLIAMAQDIRVILIKFADRLHNMRTLEYQSELKQREKAKETMEIYAPIAHRLGMQKIKWEFEDLSFYFLERETYHAITSDLDARRALLDGFMRSVQNEITARLEHSQIHGTVFGRMKHIYSIYRKMHRQNMTLEEVFDLCAFRVIVDDITDCYNVLGHMHDMYKPVPGRFKDYISTPKPNMYQSLHTTVIGEEGIPFEVQIRTWEMHHTAEYGIAAHWKYKKKGQDGSKSGDEERFAWIRRLLESQQDSGDAQDFFHDLKIDMFADEVFVFTPNGDVVNLPAKATPIDFAYSIHSAVGNRMTGAKVNGRLVTFDHTLQNGDIVEIMTTGASKGPSRDWMKIAKSSEARNKIRAWFKREKREENIAHGRQAFESEIRRQGLTMDTVLKASPEQVLRKLAFASFEDVFAAIGYGGLSAQKAAGKVRDELIALARPERTVLEKIEQQASRPEKVRAVRGIVVEGVDNCLVKFSRCCAPVPGDDIIGFITRGHGVSVHRGDCANYLNATANPEEAGRWVRVSWAQTENESYQTNLTVTAKDRDGLMLDIASALTSMKMRVKSLTVRESANHEALAFLSLEVKDKSELQLAMNKLAGISGVFHVKRSAI